MSGQAENIERVSARIGRFVRAFCGWCLYYNRPRFHVAELEQYILTNVGQVAPGSPCRILRDLRQRGVIDYIVISRSDSLYEVLRA